MARLDLSCSTFGLLRWGPEESWLLWAQATLEALISSGLGAYRRHAY